MYVTLDIFKKYMDSVFNMRFYIILWAFLQMAGWTMAQNNDINRFFTSTDGMNLFNRNSETPAPRSNVPLTRNAVPTFTNLASNILLNAVLGNQPQQSNPIIGQYTSCPVDVPFCFRTQCNAGNPRAESNPNDCHSDVTCCFDQELHQYKNVYGDTYLRGVPVCYHGPTASGFRQMARTTFPAAQQWNPFMQSLVVNFFQQAINSSEYLDVALSQCSISNLIPVQGAICGWRGIKKLECRLRGCCYDDKKLTCHYPGNFGSLLQLGGSSYPELIAKTPEETQCTSAPPYNRLPCLIDDVENATVANKIAKCHFLGCCVDLSLFLPETILAASRSGTPIPSQLQPEEGASAFRSGSALTTILNLIRSSGSQTQQATFTNGAVPSPLTCPYFSVTLPGMPDLTPKAEGCCQKVWCYQAKRMQASTTPNTPPSGGQANPGRPITLDPLNFYTPFPTVAPTPPVAQPQISAPNPFQQAPRPTMTDNEGNANPGYPDIPPELFAFVNQRNASVPFPNLIPNTPPPFVPEASQPEVVPTPQERQETHSGVWGPWGMWGECQATCGSSVRSRERSCYTTRSMSQVSMSEGCEGLSLDIEPCSSGGCQMNWGAWGSWESCSNGCGRGVQKRKRRCLYDYHEVDDFLCQGSEGEEERSCRGEVCSHWGHWSEYGGCRAECGSAGNQIFHRVCLHNENPVEPDQCSGKSSKLQSCFRKDCVFLTEWGFWEECSFTCGTGVQKRRKLCIENGLKADPSVCNGTWLDTRPCKRGLCPGLTSSTWAAWEEWGSWGDCSSSCGTGSRIRMRDCIFRGTNRVTLPVEVCQEIFKGQVALQSSSCNNQQCSETGDFYAWIGWTEYSECSSSCGVGKKTRKRYCFGESGLTNSRHCPGRREESIPCGSESTSESCADWTTWTAWTPCKATCGRGTRVRLRCKTIATVDCLNSTLTYEEEDCVAANCP